MAGDHHCPLCSATFTRPQHVGRHLRAHTGDRPYECKECPLKFARSDLLSRHVNKAHRPPGEGKPPSEKKPSGSSKARRQSLPASAMAPASTTISNIKKEIALKPAAAPRDKPRSASLNQAAFQAQQIYPHHPLLAGNVQQQQQPQTAQMPNWNTDYNHNFSVTSIPFAPGLVDPVQGTGNPNAILGHAACPNPPMFDATYSATPIAVTGSEQGFSTMDRGITTGGINYEWGHKKRACDQCNHSKVRCDFEIPCLRCTHRNLTCTYNKPQRAKTIAYPLVSGQTQSSSVGFTGPNTSISPQFKLPSPHVSSSPAESSNPNASSTRRESSVASLPPALTSHAAYPGTVTSSMPWNSYPQAAGMQASTSNAPWPQASGYTPQPAGTSSGSITGHLHDSPGNMTATLQPSGAAPDQSRGSASPQNNLAPTPALTSQTTSPSEIDEPAESRSSFSSIPGAYMPPPRHTSVQQKKIAPTLLSHNSDPVYNVSSDLSPPSTQNMSIASTVAPGLDTNQQYGFIQSNTIDPQWQARLSFSTDDGDLSALSSSANSTYIDLNDAQAGGGHHRRRSSASAWANAMAQMSLQESIKHTGAAAFPLPEPYNAAVDQSQILQKRPTFPTLSGIGEGSESSKIPSLSDVKDLWRLFMAEPMTGLTPAGEKPDIWDTAAPPITPRPGLGKRTLSKSNSMPDLQSPLINGPAFFATFMNGMTPQPTESQQSYIPPHAVQQGQSGTNSTTDNPDVKKWSREIQQRQSSFNLHSQPSAKAGKSPVTSQLSTLPNHTMLPPASSQVSYQGGRPLPSVMQHSSALQQTLAPERMPSFNMPQFTMDSSNSHQSQSPLSRQKFSVRDGQAHGFASTSTNLNSRPGNKRLASQTLMGDAGKKSTFMLFDEENDNVGQVSGFGVLGGHQQQNNQPTNINPALFAPSSSTFTPHFNLSGNTPDHSHQQQQQQHHPSRKWTQPMQSQTQDIHTQSTSMFYPNWALAPTIPGNVTLAQPEAGPMSL